MASYQQQRDSLTAVISAQFEMKMPNITDLWSYFSQEIDSRCIPTIEEEIIRHAHLKECIILHGDLGIQIYAKHWGETPLSTYSNNKAQIHTYFRELITDLYLNHDRKTAEEQITLYTGKLAGHLLAEKESALDAAFKISLKNLIENPVAGARAKLYQKFGLKEPSAREAIITEVVSALYTSKYLESQSGQVDFKHLNKFLEEHFISKSSLLAKEIKSLIQLDRLQRTSIDLIQEDQGQREQRRSIIQSNIAKLSLAELKSLVLKEEPLAASQDDPSSIEELVLKEASAKIQEHGNAEDPQFKKIISLIYGLKLNEVHESQLELELKTSLLKFLRKILLENETADLLGERLASDEKHSFITGLTRLVNVFLSLKKESPLRRDRDLKNAYLRIKEKSQGSAEEKLIKLLDSIYSST